MHSSDSYILHTNILDIYSRIRGWGHFMKKHNKIIIALIFCIGLGLIVLGGQTRTPLEPNVRVHGKGVTEAPGLSDVPEDYAERIREQNERNVERAPNTYPIGATPNPAWGAGVPSTTLSLLEPAPADFEEFKQDILVPCKGELEVCTCIIEHERFTHVDVGSYLESYQSLADVIASTPDGQLMNDTINTCLEKLQKSIGAADVPSTTNENCEYYFPGDAPEGC
jgi:hypothetical protein